MILIQFDPIHMSCKITSKITSHSYQNPSDLPCDGIAWKSGKLS